MSADGFSWTPVGTPLTLPDTSGDLHSAVYAFNGRSTNPSERAIFDHFGTGLAFHHRPDGPFQVAQFPGWTVTDDCKVPVATAISEGALRMGFPNEAVGCRWDLTRGTPSRRLGVLGIGGLRTGVGQFFRDFAAGLESQRVAYAKGSGRPFNPTGAEQRPRHSYPGFPGHAAGDSADGTIPRGGASVGEPGS